MLTFTQTLAARCGVPGKQVVGRRGRPECARPGRHDTVAPSMHREPPQHCERAGQPRRASVGASLLPLRIPAFPSLSLRVMYSHRSFASRPKNFFYALCYCSCSCRDALVDTSQSTGPRCSCRDALVDTSQSTGPRISDVCVFGWTDQFTLCGAHSLKRITVVSRLTRVAVVLVRFVVHHSGKTMTGGRRCTLRHRLGTGASARCC
jgi:hypothetical protein